MTLPSELPWSMQRTVIIRAIPEVVFHFFTDSARWAKWWGPGSTIDPRVNGRVYIRHPNGIEATGEILAINPPSSIVFSYGYAKNPALLPGSSRVTIFLAAHPLGTELRLSHDLADERMRDEHVQGWRFQLSLFANAVADEVNVNVASLVDAWFDAWADPDEKSREATLHRIASPDVTMADRYSCLTSIPDVQAHIGASQRFMPGIRMRRTGNVRHCQGWVLADYEATGSDGNIVMQGSNVFVMGMDGRIERVVGV